MKKQNLILSAALVAVFSASTAFAEAEVTGKIVHESAKFTNAGISTGGTTQSTQTADSHGANVFKAETSARIFIDGSADQVNDGATYHVELNGYFDTEGEGRFEANESYTQRDGLREAYVDAEVDDYSIRFGKQQVVWGTADGMKLLDAINPTDYTEMAQNQMEDSRIPVWMLNAETDATDGGSWQFIVSEARTSNIAGLGEGTGTHTTHSNGAAGHAFIMKGVDTITGQVNGMMNIVPAMGVVGTRFNTNGNSNGMTMASVNDFMRGNNTGETNQAAGFAVICNTVEGLGSNAACMNSITNRDVTANGGGPGADNQNKQNLFSDTTLAQWNAGVANPTSVFHYMPEASFATFDQFSGAKSKYLVKDNSTPTLALKYKNSTKEGVNYSLNFIHGNDTNPYVETHWETESGTVLAETASDSAGGFYTTNNLGNGTTVGGSVTDKPFAVFVMEEKMNKISQLGGSFDTAIETVTLGPIVLRGEALYQKDVMSPVVTRKDSTNVDLNHGFLASSLKMVKGDRFKFVLGADITALTNMMISAQYIQDSNLDFVDTGDRRSTNWKYTADMATMSLTNNLQKGQEHKAFYSLFLSKPFGASGEHRWNNIFMLDAGNGDGKWNRLDAEFSINDDTQATVEWNKYFGGTNTQFGQFNNSSNIQVGVKYSF
jgi:hypothetical protein